jgi:transcriptional regulator with XRE-family HTH domain
MSMALSNKLQELRRSSGLSLQQLAEAVGASKGHIWDLERGKATNPSIDLLRSLAARFDVTVASLIGEDGAVAVAPAPGSSAQIDTWVRQIRKEQAAGLDLQTAAKEARLSVENITGAPLDPQQLANWEAARKQIAAALDQPLEYLGNYSIRKPRRPDWYGGPKQTDVNWPPLQAFLLERRKWSPEAVGSIDRTSTEVVSLFENPAQSEFRGRGLVVGYVQSGKTANMTAVMAKAVDAGYKFIIVLAGLTNSLRKQTQARLEGDLRERNRYGWHLHTTDEDAGDFRTPANRWFNIMDQAQLAVVKKNVAPLKRLIKTIEKTPPAHRARMPVLIIDDECDQASVNAAGTQYDMTVINGLIRQLLFILPRVQYVGYTATPFANVLINPEKPQGGLDDLYPEDFITALPMAAGYFGPESLFGRDPIDADNETYQESGLDMIRTIPDAETALLRPPSAKSRFDFQPKISPSLETSLRYFVLATAARRARGQKDEHSSMLVHSTVYTVTHDRMAEAIANWKDTFKDQWRTEKKLKKELHDLWQEEATKVDASRFGRIKESFSEVEKHIDDVLKDIEIVIENSFSESRLDFRSGPKKYIVVGGSVLARGLTIEGLMVSHFIRSSSQYDTLLQMGRWFGYRFGYEDLPRIWITKDLTTAFRDLAGVEAEIRADIAEYRLRDVTPADFAVRIKQIPGMAITAAAKMISAEECDVSFSGEHLQTIRFQHKNGEILKKNWEAGETLVNEALQGRSAETRPAGRLIKGVPLKAVLKFLRSYSASAKDSFSDRLTEYIEAESRRADGPFREWNIGIVEPKDRKLSAKNLGGLGKVHLVNRARLKIERSDGAADIKALMSRRDVLIDVDTSSGDLDWKKIKAKRQEICGDKIPLLLLYAIDADSQAKAGSEYRAPLDAVADVLSVGMVLPDRGERKSYVRVALPQVKIEDGEGEDPLADGPADEGEE